jgi:site-specific DNA-methyltransferase (adenine-specific)
MKYLETENGVLYFGDCLTQLDKIEDKSQQAIIIDPPYNIGKDTWDVIPDYYNWLGEIIEKLILKLKDNGTFVIFHNDFRMLSKIDDEIQNRTKLNLVNFMIWNKRFDGGKRKGFLDGYVMKEQINSFNKMAEYFLFYTFDNSWKLKKRREELGINQLQISSEIRSKTGGITGWYSNIETGKNYPTEETIIPITKYLGLTLDDLVPKFKNQKTDHSVMNYDIESKLGHITPKPVKLLENLLLHFTDQGDSVLDCFGGSGSLAVACENLQRKWVLIEKEESYCELTKKRVSEKISQSLQSKIDF